MYDHDHSHPIAVRLPDGAGASMAPAPGLIGDLVAANHILFDQAVCDAFGHISVRHDSRPDRFLMARSMAPGLVAAEDILEYTLDGEPVNANGRKVYLERFIHSEIYRARPDIHSVVHSHSDAIVPLSVARGARLRAVFHVAGFIGPETPLFEIRDVAGDATDLLISNSELGRALAQTLGTGTVVVMRGHGSTVVATSIPEAVFRAIYAERNARYQLEASRMGDVIYLTEGEARAAAGKAGQVDRPWELWRRESAQRRAK